MRGPSSASTSLRCALGFGERPGFVVVRQPSRGVAFEIDGDGSLGIRAAAQQLRTAPVAGDLAEGAEQAPGKERRRRGAAVDAWLNDPVW